MRGLQSYPFFEWQEVHGASRRKVHWDTSHHMCIKRYMVGRVVMQLYRAVLLICPLWTHPHQKTQHLVLIGRRIPWLLPAHPIFWFLVKCLRSWTQSDDDP